jgi:hypothetical protein
MSMNEEGKTGQRLPKPYALELLRRQLATPWLIRMAYDRETVMMLHEITARWASSAVPEGKSEEA